MEYGEVWGGLKYRNTTMEQGSAAFSGGDFLFQSELLTF